jgi:hypothetical protein
MLGQQLGNINASRRKLETFAREQKLRQFCFWLNHRNEAAQESNALGFASSGDRQAENPLPNVEPKLELVLRTDTLSVSCVGDC